MCVWYVFMFVLFFFSSRRRHTRLTCDWSSDVCSSDLIARVPDETVKAVGLEAVIRLQRDKDAKAVAELKDGGDADESADGGDDQPQVADSVAVDRPTVEAIEMRWQPGEHDGDDNQRNENPAARGIFAPADSETAAAGKGVSGCAGQGQNDYPCTRGIGKESCPIAPAPNRERNKRQRATDSKSEVLD